MKRNTLLMLLIVASVALASWGSEIYPDPDHWDFRTLTQWAQPRVASATALVPVASASVGDLLIVYEPASTTAAFWRLMDLGSGSVGWGLLSGSGGGGGGGTMDHAVLSNLTYGSSGHTGFASAAMAATAVAAHDIAAAHGCAVVASEAALTAHADATAAHGCSVVASAAAITSAVSGHNVGAAHGCAQIASTAYVDAAVIAGSSVGAHAAINGTHGCTAIASAAQITIDIAVHAARNDTHGCSVIASAAAITAHNESNAGHGCAAVASTAYVAAQIAAIPGVDISGHATSNATHGCAIIASSAAISAHAALQATHGCTAIASAAAVADLSGVTASTAARANLGVLSIAESQAISANNNLTLYFNEADDAGDPSYEQLLTTPVITLASESAPKTVLSTISQMDRWISPIGGVGMTQLPAGVYQITRRITKGAGADIIVTGELWIITAASASTFVASTAPILLTADNTELVVTSEFTVGSAFSMNLTDRIVEKQYAITSGGGGNSTLLNWYGGTKQGYITIPRATTVMPISNGGTGQTASSAALTALGGASTHYVDSAVASLALGIWTETTYPATLTYNAVANVSTLASLPSTVPYSLSINSHGVTWGYAPATTTVATVQRGVRLATETVVYEIGTTTWDMSLTPDAAGTSSVCIGVGVLR